MCHRFDTRQRGFTLIELMIIIAIVGILASIAIPAYMGFANKSKHGEAQLGIESLTHKVEIYHYQHHHLPASTNQFPDVTACSQSDNMIPSRPMSDWYTNGFDVLEFHIDEPTRFQYQWSRVSTSPAAGFATATGDIDCDGVLDIYTADISEDADNVLVTQVSDMDDM